MHNGVRNFRIELPKFVVLGGDQGHRIGLVVPEAAVLACQDLLWSEVVPKILAVLLEATWLLNWRWALFAAWKRCGKGGTRLIVGRLNTCAIEEVRFIVEFLPVLKNVIW